MDRYIYKIFVFYMLLAGGVSHAEVIDCESWDGNVNGDIEFSSGCTYRGQVRINASNVTLDCNGGTINGYGVDHGEKWSTWDNTIAIHGIVIKDQEDRDANNCRKEDEYIHDVTIKNCVVKNFSGKGINLRRNFPQYLSDGTCETKYSMEDELTGRQLYDRAPKNITIIKTKVQNNEHVGIYINAYSQFYDIKNSVISNNGDVGIYLERESRNNTIQWSTIKKNGYRITSGGWVANREGIAIDASSQNKIFHNIITDNNRAGITLYKNCGEYQSRERKQHASYNQILHNTIKNHRIQSVKHSGIGIWVAMRQGLKKDEGFYNCSDRSYPGPRGEQYFDYARHNIIGYNSFMDNEHASVIIEDDYNQVVGNIFKGTSKYDAYIGNEFKQYRGEPVRGIQVIKNRTTSATNNVSGRTFVPWADAIVEFHQNRHGPSNECIHDSLAPGNGDSCSHIVHGISWN